METLRMLPMFQEAGNGSPLYINSMAVRYVQVHDDESASIIFEDAHFVVVEGEAREVARKLGAALKSFA